MAKKSKKEEVVKVDHSAIDSKIAKLKSIIKDQKTPADVLIEEFNQSQNLNSLLNQRYY